MLGRHAAWSSAQSIPLLSHQATKSFPSCTHSPSKCHLTTSKQAFINLFTQQRLMSPCSRIQARLMECCSDGHSSIRLADLTSTEEVGLLESPQCFGEASRQAWSLGKISFILHWVLCTAQKSRSFRIVTLSANIYFQVHSSTVG